VLKGKSQTDVTPCENTTDAANRKTSPASIKPKRAKACVSAQGQSAPEIPLSQDKQKKSRVAALLAGSVGTQLLKLGNGLLYSRALRPLVLHLASHIIQTRLDDTKAPVNQRKIIQQRRSMALAIIEAVERSVTKGNLSPAVAQVVAGLWAKALVGWSDRRLAVRNFRECTLRDPPLFITISPGQACNLACEGCYAGSESKGAKLEWSIVNRIIDEAKRLWNTKLVVFSGGEPLAYASEGRGVLDIVQEHPDLLFLMFTNGTLLDEDIAQRLARMGNLTPAFSVEGMRTSTDVRRGQGVFHSVVEAMGCVRKVGVPFGVSVTVTHGNIDEVLSDEFLDFFFDNQGAFYGFFFQYMPIGPRPSLEDMPTPEQRVMFWRQLWKVIENRRLFLVDMWNHGPLVQGCMSAGRGDGYLHIDWNGRVTPCVFMPYSVGNVRDVYVRGGNLNELWEAPFLEHIRKWQDSYGYGQREPHSRANWLRPCPFRDHHRLFSEWVDVYRPEPENEAAGQALLNHAYQKGLCEYGDALESLVQEIWEREYLGNQ
jgi:MoaA/NifB/PqqE/SkfB family radical SAM enzyme